MKCIDFLGLLFIFCFYSFYCLFTPCSPKKPKEIEDAIQYDEELAEDTSVQICCGQEETRQRTNSRFFAGIDDFENDL